MHTSTSKSKSPWVFFLLVFAISIPFWLIGALTEGVLPKDLPVNPVSFLAVFNPMIAALILVFRESGTDGVKGLLKRAFDYRRIQNKIWYLPMFLLLPLIYVLSYGLMNLMGRAIPAPQVPVLMAPVFFFVFFILGVGEELGWSGYAIDPLQARWTALAASIIVGIVWGVWHIVPDIQAHHTSMWIVWQRVYAVPLRVLIVWLYNNTGKSVFAASTFHAMDNVSWGLVFSFGPYYDPFFTCIITAATAAIVSFLWGPKTLARYRYA